MANYNVDEPDERGYWYDFKISKKVTGHWVNLLVKVNHCTNHLKQYYHY